MSKYVANFFETEFSKDTFWHDGKPVGKEKDQVSFYSEQQWHCYSNTLKHSYFVLNIIAYVFVAAGGQTFPVPSFKLL